MATVAVTLVIASGVAVAVNKVGTDGPDTLRGTNRADNLLGKGGKDTLFGLGGSDSLLGGPGNDSVQGYRGHDGLVGDSGNDLVVGWEGADNVMGAGGTDLLVDGPFHGPFDETSEDNVSGGDGNDVVFSNSEPAFKDLVTCGRGFDRVAADRKDMVAPDCEKVAVGPAAIEELHEGLADSGFFESFFGGLPPDPGV